MSADVAPDMALSGPERDRLAAAYAALNAKPAAVASLPERIAARLHLVRTAA